tara:strand:+ start:486 stop:1385 length:900 start_codon:yes stop_codon:yes gene_type:complete
MNILLTGSKGQLGKIIKREIFSSKFDNSINLFCPSRETLDLGKKDQIHSYIIKNKPDWIINTAAYTNVENAEKNSNLAYKVNTYAVYEICKALDKYGGKLIQLSTDYVFDGKKNKPYKIKDNRNPLNIYGRSKSNAELIIEETLNKKNQSFIVRTSWLMGLDGENFANKILDLLKKDSPLKIINDQFGRPTTTKTLAKAILRIIEKVNKGKQIQTILHCCNSGIASWYEIAVELQNIGLKFGTIKKRSLIESISTLDYGKNVKRPSYSVLDLKSTSDCLDFEFIHWKKALHEIFSNINY